MEETSDSDADSDEDEKIVSVEDGPDPSEVSTTTDIPSYNIEHTQDRCTQRFQCETNFKKDESLDGEAKAEKYWSIQEGRGFQKIQLQQPRVIFTPGPMEQHFLSPLSTSNNFLIHPNPFYFGRNLSSVMSSEGTTLDTARPSPSSQGRNITPGLPIYVQQPSFSSPQVRRNILNH